MIRTLVPDVLRYGDYSRLGESIYDHPYQWGSRRAGPDIARVGGKYNHAWHYDHMLDPRAISPGSNMPSYSWLDRSETDLTALPSKISVMRTLGVPYPEWSADEVVTNARTQATQITEELRAQGRYVSPDREIVALISYLQKLGKSEPVAARTAASGAR